MEEDCGTSRSNSETAAQAGPSSVKTSSSVSKPEVPCIFSFDPAHISAFSMTTDTSTVQAQSAMKQNSTYFPTASNLSQPHSSMQSHPCHGGAPWMGSSPRFSHGPHSVDGGMFQAPRPSTVPINQPHGMFTPPGVLHDRMYQMQQMYHLQLMRQGERLSQPHQPRSTSMLVHRQPPPPLWNTPSPQFSASEERQRTDQDHPSPAFVLRAMERAPVPTLQTYYQRPGVLGNATGVLSDSARRIYRIEQPWVTNRGNVIRPVPVYANQPPPICCEVSKPPQSSGGFVSKASEIPPNSSLLQHEAWTQEKKSSTLIEKNPEIGSLENYESPLPSRQIKKRSVVDEDTVPLLETDFQLNRSPTQAQIAELAERYHLTKGAVRAWFSSRRQKQKRLDRESGLAKQKRSIEGSQEAASLKVPSQKYDITVEVPSINPRDRGSVIHQDYQGK